ncbi:hypothetical protein K3495_g16674, partial [Podosphaera aphanis]
MRILVPESEDSDSSTTESLTETSTLLQSELLPENLNDLAELSRVLESNSGTRSHINRNSQEVDNQESTMNPSNTSDDIMNVDHATSASSNQTSGIEASQKLSRLNGAISTLPENIQSYLLQVMEGQQPQQPQQAQQPQVTPIASMNFPPVTKNIPHRDDNTMRRDAQFAKWDGVSSSWTPHFHLLKVQCRVYGPALGSEEA